MPRRGENIYKRKDGRWEGRYIKGKDAGKTHYGYVYSKTYRDVKVKLAAITDAIKKVPTQTSPLISTNFRTASLIWLESKKPQLKQSSITRYTNLLSTYIYPSFGLTVVNQITREDILIFNRQLLCSGGEKGMGLSPKTVSSILSVIKNVLKYTGCTENYILSDSIKISVKQSQKPMRIFSIAEQKRLGNYLSTDSSDCNLGILICLYTGIRIGEVCALKWEDISFEERCIYVRKTMQRIQKLDGSSEKTAVIITEPKSSCSIREIPIPSDLFYILSLHQKSENAFLLTGKYDHYMEPRTLQNRFKSILKSCNITDVNFHTLRHTFATRCVELGFDIKSLSEILGHANVNITLNRYVHPSMELKQKNMNKLSELFAVK